MFEKKKLKENTHFITLLVKREGKGARKKTEKRTMANGEENV
jgi:hypothetical protein